MGDGPWSANKCTYLYIYDTDGCLGCQGGGQQDLQDGWDGDNPMLFFGGVEWFTLR